jgi:hypothetical protein
MTIHDCQCKVDAINLDRINIPAICEAEITEPTQHQRVQSQIFLSGYYHRRTHGTANLKLKQYGKVP